MYIYQEYHNIVEVTSSACVHACITYLNVSLLTHRENLSQIDVGILSIRVQIAARVRINVCVSVCESVCV